MKVGEKIKFIRNLRGMTQKELGLAVGFSASTADIRIRQYEMGKMNPKEDKLELIANALKVPVEALNNIDLDQGSGNTLFNVLFELERNEGLQIRKIDGQFVMSFDPDHPLFDYYSEGLSSWYYARKKFFPTKEDLKDEDKIHDYQIWTQEYPENVIREEEAISSQIKNLHSIAIEKAKRAFSINTVAEYIKLFENMLRCNINLNISVNPLHTGAGNICVRIRLSHAELLELKEPAIKAYADFIALIDYLDKSHQDMIIATNSYNNISYDEYNIISSTLSTALLTVVAQMQEQLRAGTFDDENTQLEYTSSLKQFNIPIKDAIHYSY